jgi:hypothetical protein
MVFAVVCVAAAFALGLSLAYLWLRKYPPFMH